MVTRQPEYCSAEKILSKGEGRVEQWKCQSAQGCARYLSTANFFYVFFRDLAASRALDLLQLCPLLLRVHLTGVGSEGV